MRRPAEELLSPEVTSWQMFVATYFAAHSEKAGYVDMNDCSEAWEHSKSSFEEEESYFDVPSLRPFVEVDDLPDFSLHPETLLLEERVQQPKRGVLLHVTPPSSFPWRVELYDAGIPTEQRFARSRVNMHRVKVEFGLNERAIESNRRRWARQARYNARRQVRIDHDREIVQLRKAWQAAQV